MTAQAMRTTFVIRLARSSLVPPTRRFGSFPVSREFGRRSFSGARVHPLSGVSSATSSSDNQKEASNVRPHPLSGVPDTTSSSEKSEVASDEALVYESPLGKIVSKLRTVSLLSGILGGVGLPLVLLLKGGDVPSTGFLAMGFSFVAATTGSTVAVHYIFHPYVFSIVRIPVRRCSYKKKNVSKDNDQTSQSEKGDMPVLEEPKKPRDVMLKAITKSLFLQQRDVVFDPETEVAPFTGLRPLCNFQVRGTPLYVHPEFVYDETLRKQLNLDKVTGSKPPAKENPDDFL